MYWIAITGGGGAGPPNRGARSPPPPPPLPSAGGGGGGVNQSCLTADMWFHSVIRYLPGQKGQSTAIDERVASEWHEGGMAWHDMAWSDMAWLRFILDI